MSRGLKSLTSPIGAAMSSSSPLRLVLVSGNYNYVKDGAVFALNQLVHYLENRSVPVMVLAPQPWDPVFPSFGTVTKVPSLPLGTRTEYRLALGIPRAVREQVRAFKPTLFHVASPDPLGYHGIRLARKWNVPVVASYHARHDLYIECYRLGFLAPLWQRYLRHLYAPCRQVYAPSLENVSWLREQGIASDVRLWSRGVRRDLFHPGQRSMSWRRSLGIEDSDVVILFVGRLSPEKNIDTVIPVLRALRDEGIAHRPLFVGEGPERSRLEKALPHALFTGYLEGEALARAYASSDIFFFPSITETFGIVTLEAMASGLPLVCARSMGSRDLVDHGENGRLIDPKDHAGFVAALKTLAQSPELRQKLGEKGVEKSQKYTWDHVMQTLHAHYLQALEQSP